MNNHIKYVIAWGILLLGPSLLKAQEEQPIIINDESLYDSVLYAGIIEIAKKESHYLSKYFDSTDHGSLYVYDTLISSLCDDTFLDFLSQDKAVLVGCIDSACYRVLKDSVREESYRRVHPEIRVPCPVLNNNDTMNVSRLMYLSPMWKGRYVFVLVMPLFKEFEFDRDIGYALGDYISMGMFLPSNEYVFVVEDGEVISYDRVEWFQ